MVAVWALMAVMNLAAGIVISSSPERQTDLGSMRRWGQIWLIQGTDVYRAEGEAPDYPPHAIVMLSPLALLVAGLAAPAWASVNLVLAALAVYLAVRGARPRDSLPAIAVPMLMLLCWGGFRTLLQFSLLTLTLGLAAMELSDRRPTWSGVCLGLALMKPQIAAPFVLWALFTRRFRPLGVATAVVVAGFAVYCVRVHVNPFSVAASYLDILRFLHAGGTSGLVGIAQLRPLIGLAISNPAVVDVLAGAIALTLLAGICVLGFTEGRRRPTLMYSAPALAGLWSLLSFYHLTYGFLLLLPTATQLMFANDPQTATFRTRVFWLLQAGLMADVPGLWRRFGHLLAAPAGMNGFLMNFDRILMLALFACILRLAARAENA